MKFLTVDAKMTCKHATGVVLIVTGQHLVTINGRPVLVAHDPQNKVIAGCCNLGPTIKPCTRTLAVTRGYSSFIFVDGHAVCLDTITGVTDGTPPGMVEYVVKNPGQRLVEGSS